MPESGMGYQKIDITLKSGRIIPNLIVLNSEHCEASEEFDPADIIDVNLHSND
jgi:hypothetical protein